jgi:hypothetical protein
VFNYKKRNAHGRSFPGNAEDCPKINVRLAASRGGLRSRLQNANHTLDFSFVGERNGEDWLGETWVKFSQWTARSKTQWDSKPSISIVLTGQHLTKTLLNFCTPIFQMVGEQKGQN